MLIDNHIGRAVLQFFTEPAGIYPDTFGIACVIFSPHLFHDLTVGYDLIPIFHQNSQESVLHRGKPDQPVVYFDLLVDEVNFQAGINGLSMITGERYCLGAAKYRPDTCQ